MKRTIVLIAFLLSMVFVAGMLSAGNQKRFTEADVKKCMAKKKRESAARGYPITDPFALRNMCIKELKENK